MYPVPSDGKASDQLTQPISRFVLLGVLLTAGVLLGIGVGVNDGVCIAVGAEGVIG